MRRVLKTTAWLLALAFALTGCGRGAASEPSAVPAVTEAVTMATDAPTTQPPETEPPEQHLTFTFAGDCTLGSHTAHTHAGYGFILTVGQDYDHPFRNVKQWFEQDDFTMVNLEGVLGDQGQPAGRKYAFRGPGEYVQILTGNSVEAVSLANNHTIDYGDKGYAETKRLLEEAGVPFVEPNSSTIVTLENGMTVGIYGTVYNSIDEEAMVTGIRALKEQGVDLVIYAPHWGTEHSFRPTEQQETLGRAAIDAGADIVYGCHPHVLQPIEEYGDGVIFYSLGNFSFGGNIYPADFDTALIQQEVIWSAGGGVRLEERTIVPCSISSIADRNNYQPTPYEPGSQEYDRVMSKLDGTYDGPNLPVH
ncbi:MAG: CapA family protein [Faecousia sp.]